MSPGGEQIWTFHFSSGLVFDYDFPVKILIAPNNDIYLLGSAVYYTSEGAGYILKIMLPCNKTAT
ncbi:MAG: hypothetical protein EPGJADBJ_04918 [Saprospiraceae bacterium]|nr:hypothetical protein [Saprospiraceae bacterium]